MIYSQAREAPLMSDLTYKKRFGDRRDGRRIRSMPAINNIMAYIMPKKYDACNFFTDRLEISDVERWLKEKRSEGYKGIGMLHVFIASYVRTVAHCPKLNRFIAGQKVYAANQIQVVMTVKRAMNAEAPETAIKVTFEPTDTIFDVYRKFNEKIDEIKANDGDNNTEQAASLLMKVPGLFLRFAVWLLRGMDYFDLLPQSLINASPFHGSMIITDLGSLGIPPIYHHIYDFGTLPLFIAFGAKFRSVELDKSGEPVERKYIEYKAVMDERTIDGMSYAIAFKYLKYYLRNPAALELPPAEVKEDIP